MLAAVVVSVSSTATVNAYVPGFNGFVGASIGASSSVQEAIPVKPSETSYVNFSISNSSE